MSQVAAVGEGNFETEVMAASQSQLVIVDFWAEWCQPCKMIAPVLDRLADKFQGRVKFVKCNVDENQEIAAQYAINSIPNLIFFREGQVVDQELGFRGEGALASKIDEVLED